MFLRGLFYAESLILAETGNSVGAIQIAGTSEAAQLPFFVAACDYTLIGEELFAASAYLTGEPQQLGSLKGQDAGSCSRRRSCLVRLRRWSRFPPICRRRRGSFLALTCLGGGNAMKSTIPWLIAAIAGCVMIAAYFIPAAQSWQDEAGNGSRFWPRSRSCWAAPISACRICRRFRPARQGWGYAAVTLITFRITLGVGMFKVGVPVEDPEHPGRAPIRPKGAPVVAVRVRATTL